MAKALGAWPMSWGRGLGLGGVAKAVGAWPMPRVRGQGIGGAAKFLGALPRSRCMDKGTRPRPWGVVKAVGASLRP